MEPYAKFEEKPPDKWNEWFKGIYGEGSIKVKAIATKEDSNILPPETILIEQLRDKAGG